MVDYSGIETGFAFIKFAGFFEKIQGICVVFINDAFLSEFRAVRGSGTLQSVLLITVKEIQTS